MEHERKLGVRKYRHPKLSTLQEVFGGDPTIKVGCRSNKVRKPQQKPHQQNDEADVVTAEDDVEDSSDDEAEKGGNGKKSKKKRKKRKRTLLQPTPALNKRNTDAVEQDDPPTYEEETMVFDLGGANNELEDELVLTYEDEAPAHCHLPSLQKNNSNDKLKETKGSKKRKEKRMKRMKVGVEEEKTKKKQKQNLTLKKKTKRPRFRILYGDEKEIEEERQRRLAKRRKQFEGSDSSPSSSPDLIDDDELMYFSTSITAMTTTYEGEGSSTEPLLALESLSSRFPTTIRPTPGVAPSLNNRTSALSAQSFMKRSPRFCTTGLRRLIPSTTSPPKSRFSKAKPKLTPLVSFAEHDVILGGKEETPQQEREEGEGDAEAQKERKEEGPRELLKEGHSTDTLVEDETISSPHEPLSATLSEPTEPSQSPSPPPSGRIRRNKARLARLNSSNLMSGNQSHNQNGHSRDPLEERLITFDGLQTPPSTVSTYVSSKPTNEDDLTFNWQNITVLGTPD